MDQSTRGAWMIGGVVGVVGAIIALGLGLVGSLCCIANLANWVLPAVMGGVAGGIAAARVDWTQVEPGTGSGVGVGVGLRAGAAAAMVTTAAYLVVAFLMPIVTVGIQVVLAGNTDQLIPTLIGSAIGLAIAWAMSLGIALISTLGGVGLGAASGAIVGSSMGNS